jgi:hypothetical protein
MATTKETVLARIFIDDNTKVGFQSYARNAERAKKTTEAFRAHAVDKLVESLDQQVLAIGKSARELDLLKAATLSASDAEFEAINNLHDKIDVHNRATEAAIRGRKEAELQEAATKRIADAVNRTNNAYRDEAATVDMTSDELEIYRLKMMGASQAQLDSVMATQQATKEFRKQGSAAKGAHGQLRLMRGGLGQLGHQVQDIAVQLQMGQNALLIFGQQGSQVASLFGQNGALIGAVLAVGAALGTYLMPKVFSSKDALEEIKKSAEATAEFLKIDFVSGVALLTDKFDELTKKSESLAKATLQIELVNAMKNAKGAVTGFKDELSNLIPSTLGTETNVVIDEITVLSRKYGVAREDLKKVVEAQKSYNKGTGATIDSIAELMQSISDSRMQTAEQAEEFLKANLRIQEFKVASQEAGIVLETLREVLFGNATATEAKSKADTEAKDKADELKRTVDEHVQSLIDENTQLVVGLKTLQALQLARKGYSAQQIKEIFRLQEVNQGLRDAKALRDEDAAALRAQALSAENYVNGVVAQADALGKSNIELLLANDLVKGLDTDQKKAFDNAIQRLKDFQAAQEQAQKVESSKGNLESLRQSLMTEEQALLESFAEQNRIIAEGLALGNETVQSARDLQLQITAKYLEDKKALLDQGVTDELEGMSFLERATIEGTKRLETFNKLSATEQTQHVLGELSGQFSGIAKNNKKLFELSKKLNIASAIMNTADAATLAYKSYPPPLNYVMAGGVIAAGMGQVAQIKAQSFDGGGFTGTGGRSGGMDGKGGFPAILHPNETVIDHTKGQGGGITVVNNIDATGAGADVDMKIRAAMQQTSQQTILSIQDLMRRRRFG